MSKAKINIGGKDYAISADLYGMRLFAEAKGLEKITDIQDFFAGINAQEITFEQMDDIVLLVQSFITSASDETESPEYKVLYNELFSDGTKLEQAFKLIEKSFPQEKKEVAKMGKSMPKNQKQKKT